MNRPLPSSRVVGALGVPHLKRLWSTAMAARTGAPVRRPGEARLDRLVLDALGLGLHQTWHHLMSAGPTFEAFEAWVVATVGPPDALRVERLQATLLGAPPPPAVRSWMAAVEAAPPVLTGDDLACWQANGYVVLRQAVGEAVRRDAERAVYAHVDATSDARESWYRGDGRHGIMVELIQHPALEAVRRSPRIHKAYAQLWGSADLWVSADRCGFHPPQRNGAPFPGPDLHWDLDFGEPLAFETQGIVYLADTPAEQGALTVVPGFQRRLPDWLASLPPGADPQRQDLHALGPKPVAGRAGDMVIWHAWLPHGSRPNLGERPRVVQYVNMMPGLPAPE
ncbi:phytanoyl-CoA dioxygenase family protein [Fulvimonas sp. R45]|uniref:phytanoyl-CoA dioxygenase family protein n=1 Tax=Fulvimonas sp. R45 TaxID=3045937 RepID=UPI00265E685B|nr:phytanoyl-CoA dioxygenase family protein [Fulvimonas sp. R45]MDO1528560.1 phytanoyl-CoA dioxygenase family protein [Fulvimonas sp. R45]